jgi:hypothetical protein
MKLPVSLHLCQYLVLRGSKCVVTRGWCSTAGYHVTAQTAGSNMADREDHHLSSALSQWHLYTVSLTEWPASITHLMKPHMGTPHSSKKISTHYWTSPLALFALCVCVCVCVCGCVWVCVCVCVCVCVYSESKWKTFFFLNFLNYCAGGTLRNL